MYYYEFAEMNNLPISVREAVEDIYLVVNQEWDFDEKMATEKMVKMLENPKKMLEKLISLDEKEFVISKRVLKDSETNEKLLKESKEMEDLLEEVRKEMNNTNDNLLSTYLAIGFDAARMSENVQTRVSMDYITKLEIVSFFVLKMAVYKFCKVHFPNILDESSQVTKINVKKIGQLKEQMEKWEKQFWSIETDEIDENFEEQDLYGKRELLRKSYDGSMWGDMLSGIAELYNKETGFFGFGNMVTGLSNTTLSRIKFKDILECVQRAFEDVDIVESVKKLQDDFRANYDLKCIEYINDFAEEIPEIESMRKLLDLMEKQLNGELSSEEVGELKKHVPEWSKDIQSLTEMINKLS